MQKTQQSLRNILFLSLESLMHPHVLAGNHSPPPFPSHSTWKMTGQRMSPIKSRPTQRPPEGRADFGATDDYHVARQWLDHFGTVALPFTLHMRIAKRCHGRRVIVTLALAGQPSMRLWAWLLLTALCPGLMALLFCVCLLYWLGNEWWKTQSTEVVTL